MPRTVLVSAILLASVFFCVGRSFGFTITVDCTGNGDYLTIQEGIDASVDGDTVLVSPCTYTGSGNHDIDFHGKAIVLVSSDGPEMTIVDCQELGRGFTFHSVELETSILDGFTIKKGRQDVGEGGGIYIYYAGPTVTHCNIESCYAFNGGGILATGGAPDINHCVIEDNSAFVGGGIYVGSYTGGFGSGPSISNCTFTANLADHDGGGMYYYNVTPFVYSFLWGCRFENNRTTGYSTYGGGIYFDASKVSVYNCLFDGNTSPAEGGGIYCFDSEVLIHNCTFVYNDAFYGSGIGTSISNTTIFNCILWWNGSSPIYGGPNAVTYSDIEGGWSGTGNIDTDPQFMDEIDYHLSSGSPCVDAGDPSIVDGSLPPGMGGDRSDMGAYGGSSNGEWLEGPFDLFLYPTGPTTVTAGDTVFFDALIWDSMDNPATGDYWLSLVLPNSRREILVPPTILNHSNPLHGTTPAHGTSTISSELRTILTGTYTVIARIGVYPNTVVDEESFQVLVN